MTPAVGSTLYTLDPSSVAIASNAAHGNAVANADNTVTYTPTGGYAGSDAFIYRVTANNGVVSSSATVTVNVQATLPPTAKDDPDPTMPNAATANGTHPLILAVLANDIQGAKAINSATVTVTTAARYGATSVNGTTGEVTYTANAAFSGIDTFKYTVSDTTAQTSNPATVSVTVLAIAPASETGALTPGTTAAANGSANGGGLTPSMVGTDPDLAQQCLGGCFDLQATGLAAGASVNLVLPLSAALPPGAVYRERVAGVWQDFSTTGGNAVASAPAVSAGVCPQAGSPAYASGLTAGNECLQLTLVDGGPNDADSVANGTVLDPGGIGVKIPAATGSSGGCSLSTGRVNPTERGDWGLILGFIAWLGLLRRRQNCA